MGITTLREGYQKDYRPSKKNYHFLRWYGTRTAPIAESFRLSKKIYLNIYKRIYKKNFVSPLRSVIADALIRYY